MTETPQETPTEPAEAPETPQEPAEGEPVAPEAPETPEQPETPEEPVQPPMSEAQLEKDMKRLEKSATVWRNRVSEVMGEAAQALLPCPRCDPDLPGFIWPPELAAPGEEQTAAVLASVGLAMPQAYVHADDASVCDKCNGLGSVETGSKVRGQEVLTCRHCSGRGWIGPRAQLAAAPAPVPNGDEPAPISLVQPSVESDPPEVVMLREQGYIVVAPIQG